MISQINNSPFEHNLSGANGSKICVKGSLDCFINIQNKEFPCKMIVAKDIYESILLGSDFLTQHGCVLDFSNLILTIGNIRTPLLKTETYSRKGPKSFKLKIAKTIRIPAKTTANNIQCEIRSKSYSNKCYHTTTGILIPASTLLARKFNVQSPSLLLNICKGKTAIQITNPNEHEIIIFRNQTIGSFEKISKTTVNLINQSSSDCSSEQTPKQFVNPENSAANDAEKLKTLFSKLEIDSMNHLSTDQIKKLKDLVTKYRDIFYDDETGLPAANLPPHDIILDTNKPIRTPYRQIPIALKPKAEELITDLMNKGIIEPSTSPYHSPAFVIKRGSKYRIVVDYRNVNRHVVRNYQPLPSVESITALWAGCQYWSVVDLHSAYFQLRLTEKSKPITACSIPGVAFFQFTRVPLGISSAVGYFQGVIEQTLLGIKNVNCVNYLDDIASAARTFDQMLLNIEAVFERLQIVGLKIKAEKTKLFKRDINYLGFKLSSKGVEVDPSKTEAVTKMSVPTNKKGVRAFAGFCSFYRKFIKGYGDIMKPLTNLFKKDVPFTWGPEQQNAFDTIRQKLVNAPILQLPDINKRFYLTCDASSSGIGCVLQQKSDDGILLPISFASNVLSKTQQKWSSFQREFYSLVYYCKKFKHFLLNKKFTARVDNQALTKWQNFKEFDNPKLWRWFLTLSQFDFDIEYIPTHKNESDGPSRLPRTNDLNVSETKAVDTSINNTTIHQNNVTTNNSDQSRITNSANEIEKPTVSAHDLTKITDAQNNDECLKTVISWVKQGEKPKLSKETQKLTPDLKVYYNSFNRLTLLNGILYRSWERKGNEMPNNLICIPSKLTTDIIKLCHDIPTGGHLGKPKTLAKVQSRFYWPHMQQEISLYVDACDICLKKAQKQKLKSPLQPFNGKYPNDIVQFDLMENLPQNPKGYKSILVIVDRFTSWVEAVPLRDTKSTTIAKALLDTWIARNGVPGQLHSDRGPNFTSEVIQIVCKLMGSSKTFTTAYRPMSDGGAEAAVKIVKNLLKGFCSEHPQKWPDLLQQCLFAYRTSIHSGTGYSPFFLHRGHSARIPMDILLGTFNQKQFNNHQRYAYDLYKTLKHTYNYVEENLRQRRDFTKRQYDKRSNVVPFGVGQYVYVWRPRPPNNKNKFYNHFCGPYKITKKVTDFTYKLDLEGKSKMHDIVPHDLLRLSNKLDTIPEEPEEGTDNEENRNNEEEEDDLVILRPAQIDNQLPQAHGVPPYNLRNRANLRAPRRYWG